eukprot:TRINITY_DN15777_c0_g1_i1.p1 TRINITY_DN15777_c0_g1~~TRINITY_DN15777_c0_g1_i1.p1  ORF type:complete len:442 (+),score=188.67 TRINITY_DN15777_c0_g1_i1:46-1371(+)
MAGQPSSTPPAASPVGYERDDARSYGIESLEKLLLPDGQLPLAASASSFALAYSSGALGGWLRQPTPICAAASLAGAWNTAARRERGTDGSASVEDMLRVLIQLSRERLDTKESTLQRLLLHPVGQLRERVEARLREEGRSLAGRKQESASPKLCRELLRVECAERVLDAAAGPQMGEDGLPVDAIASLADAWKMKEEGAREVLELHRLRRAGQERPKQEDVVAKPADEGEEEEEELQGSDSDEEGKEKEKKRKPKGKKEKEKQKPLDVLVNEALAAWWRNLLTYERLARESVPSTGGIGNWGLLEAAPRLEEALGRPATAALLMGKCGAASGMQIKNGEEADVAQEWRFLWDSFTAPDTALIFHLTNHYALIFALRQWQSSDGTWVRQLLTARRGQRPAVWMDWADARRIMLGWAGYRILSLTVGERDRHRAEPPAAAGD